MTSHNRRDTTLASLRAMLAADHGGATVSVTLTDAGSDDGTRESVAEEFPEVSIVEAGADVFWAGGTRRAQDAALARGAPDHLLWLNDDVVLRPGAVAALVAAHEELSRTGHRRPIVVGTTVDPRTGALTYGGVRRKPSLRRFAFETVEPGSHPERCDTMNGNIVLVPRSVYLLVGGLDPAFTHGIADFDYGLRARDLGCEVWVAPGVLGTCTNEVAARREYRTDLSRRERWRSFTSVKGLPPRQWAILTRRHAGPLWPVAAASPYFHFALALLRPRRRGADVTS